MYRVTQQVLDFKETFTNLFCPKHAGIPGINYTYVVTLDINQMEKGESFSPKSYFFFSFSILNGLLKKLLHFKVL